MFRTDQINVPILGIVENMAWFTPAPHPDEKYFIFGNGGAEKLAKELQIPLLAQIPLVADICSDADSGAPSSTRLMATSDTGDSDSENPEAAAFAKLADTVVEKCNLRNDNLPPTTVVEVKNN